MAVGYWPRTFRFSPSVVYASSDHPNSFDPPSSLLGVSVFYGPTQVLFADALSRSAGEAPRRNGVGNGRGTYQYVPEM